MRNKRRPPQHNAHAWTYAHHRVGKAYVHGIVRAVLHMQDFVSVLERTTAGLRPRDVPLVDSTQTPLRP